MIDPKTIVSPKSQIKRVVKVLYNDAYKTPPGDLEFSIARLELHNGTEKIGIRHDISYWSENKEIGYPAPRGNPGWFILPDMDDLLPKLNELFGDKK
jgi:hypothetical protein